MLTALRLVAAAIGPAHDEVVHPAGRQPGQGQAVRSLEQRVGDYLGVRPRRRAVAHLAGGEFVGCPGDLDSVGHVLRLHVADLRRDGVADQRHGIGQRHLAAGIGVLQDDAGGDLAEERLQRRRSLPVVLLDLQTMIA